MSNESTSTNVSIPRATGLLVIVVENSNPNGDPDQENDPRRRSHDNRGMITGVSFKRKLRDIVLRKDAKVWTTAAAQLGITETNGRWSRDDYFFDVMERRDINRADVTNKLRDPTNLSDFKSSFWDARVFGNTFLEEGLSGEHIRTGVAHFSLAVSVAPVRVHRLTKTKQAPAEGEGVQSGEGPSRGMAPLAHRIVEHGVYCMPFFVNPSGADGKRGTGCTALDIALLLKLIRAGYLDTKSDIRGLVGIHHAWYAEHDDPLGSFSEFEFIEAMTPIRRGDTPQPSVSGLPLREQYDVPAKLPDGFRGKLKGGKLYDLCCELPPWCAGFKAEG